MSGIVKRLRDTAALYLGCLENQDAHYSKILEAADTITDLLAVLELILSDEDVALSRPDYVLARHTVAKAKGETT